MRALAIWPAAAATLAHMRSRAARRSTRYGRCIRRRGAEDGLSIASIASVGTDGFKGSPRRTMRAIIAAALGQGVMPFVGWFTRIVTMPIAWFTQVLAITGVLLCSASLCLASAAELRLATTHTVNDSG